MSLINLKGALFIPDVDLVEWCKRHELDVSRMNMKWCEWCGLEIHFVAFARGTLRGITAKCECGNKPGAVIGDSLEHIFSEAGR